VEKKVSFGLSFLLHEILILSILVQHFTWIW